jgi:ribosome-binding protein aMBF1 (putative translation factor)
LLKSTWSYRRYARSIARVIPETSQHRLRDADALRVFGANVRAARERAGLTQEQLGLRAGFDMSNISRYEAGQQEPGLTVVVRLARGLGVQPAELLRDLT